MTTAELQPETPHSMSAPVSPKTNPADAPPAAAAQAYTKRVRADSPSTPRTVSFEPPPAAKDAGEKLPPPPKAARSSYMHRRMSSSDEEDEDDDDDDVSSSCSSLSTVSDSSVSTLSPRVETGGPSKIQRVQVQNNRPVVHQASSMPSTPVGYYVPQAPPQAYTINERPRPVNDPRPNHEALARPMAVNTRGRSNSDRLPPRVAQADPPPQRQRSVDMQQPPAASSLPPHMRGGQLPKEKSPLAPAPANPGQIPQRSNSQKQRNGPQFEQLPPPALQRTDSADSRRSSLSLDGDGSPKSPYIPGWAGTPRSSSKDSRRSVSIDPNPTLIASSVPPRMQQQRAPSQTRRSSTTEAAKQPRRESQSPRRSSTSAMLEERDPSDERDAHGERGRPRRADSARRDHRHESHPAPRRNSTDSQGRDGDRVQSRGRPTSRRHTSLERHHPHNRGGRKYDRQPSYGDSLLAMYHTAKDIVHHKK